MENELEYICESKSEKDWQKQLNQWKHMYDINIISMVHCTNATHDYKICILLTRIKKVVPSFDHSHTQNVA